MTDDAYEAERKLTHRRKEMREASHKEAVSIFTLAGLPILYTWELANGYWPDHPDYDEVRRPWWLFLTEIGPVRIGRRKSVLHIQWTACTFRGVITEDEVTKDEDYVHAWNVESAVKYVRELATRARAAKPPNDVANQQLSQMLAAGDIDLPSGERA